MRWVAGGPDLPEELLQLLEDGELVLFCGAGVSCSAGLPGFRDLVDRIYKENNERMEDTEKHAFDQGDYDEVLKLLEGRIGSRRVRRAVKKILHLGPNADVTAHSALLSLATGRDGVCRLVTTNFDCGFQMAARGTGIAIDAAPKLPLPKRGQWNSVVHLHGCISDADPDGRTLVLTSADFGAAYLTDRWASRFLTDLFRAFSLLFVGYSLKDPVIRYLMHALAADRQAGEKLGTAFVLAPYSDYEEQKRVIAEWKAKGVTPVPYDKRDNHTLLYETLQIWADRHRLGLQGKDAVIYEHTPQAPTEPFAEDPKVSQVVWALKEPSGCVARVFGRLDPLPPVEWLPVLKQNGLLAMPQGGEWGVPLVDDGARTVSAPSLHPVSRCLGEWIVRHIEKLEVLDWALRAGSILHPEFRWIIQERLRGDPSMPEGLRRIWEILASDASLVAGSGSDLSLPFDDLLKSVAKGEWHFLLKQDILHALTPVLILKPKWFPDGSPHARGDGSDISEFVEAEVAPRSREATWSVFDGIQQSPIGDRILADLAEDATELLRRAMQLAELVELADSRADRSYGDQPSIAPHPQNSRYHAWTALIEFCRDSWRALLQADRDQARLLVERWKRIPYPVFRRLCFFAMAESDLYTPDECLAYLLQEDGWWLWSVYVYREKFQFLKALWPKLADGAASELTERILRGPPRAMFQSDVSDHDVKAISDREIWLHLAKLQSKGRELPKAGRRRLRELSARFPQWELTADDRDEFVIWTEAWWGELPVPNRDEFLKLSDEEVMPRLSGDVSEATGDEARWRHLIAEQPERGARILWAVAERGHWPPNAWQAALETLRLKKQRIVCVWATVARALSKAPDQLYVSVRAPLSHCLVDVAETLPAEEKTSFWTVWDRALRLVFDGKNGGQIQPPSDPLFVALNTPAGNLTQALLIRMAAEKPKTRSDVASEVWDRLTKLAEGRGEPYACARVLLASRLTWLHKLAPEWVEEHLIRYLKWEDNPEAAGIWQGFLWRAGISPELWPQIKPSFLAALRHAGQMPQEAGKSMCALFAIICVNWPDWISDEEAQKALKEMDDGGRAAVAAVIKDRMQGAGTQGQTLWKERIGPWLQSVWPKDLALRGPDASFNLALAATYAGSLFNEAVDTVEEFITPSKSWWRLTSRLLETDIPAREPKAALRLLGKVVDRTWRWPDLDLRTLLNQIREADPTCEAEKEYQELDLYLHTHGR